jgi:MtN3 and saliva related transmembrane protein
MKRVDETSLVAIFLPRPMDQWLFLGLLAGLLTTLGFVPQIIKSVRTKRMGEVSLLMPLLLSVGIFLWLLYGLTQRDLAIVLWNAVALCLNLALVGLKMYYRELVGQS